MSLKNRSSDAGHDVEKALLESSVTSPRRSYLGINPALFSGLCYCAASGSMVLLNKHALASFNFTAPNALLGFQCLLAAFLVKMCHIMGYVELQPLKRDLVLTWLPVNVIFVGMTGSSFYALQSVGVGMVTVMKNLSNFITAVCDVLIFKKSYSLQLWLCLCLMLASAGAGAKTDKKFTYYGYAWQIANCLFTSAYALTLRNVMDKVSQHTTTKQKMDEFSMVYYNNLLSLPFIMALMWYFGEWQTLPHQAALANPMFQTVALMGGLIGFAISFSGLWFLSQTTATIYSLVGALNKIPVAIVGIVAFHEASSAKNAMSIAIGLFAGVLFVHAKARGK